ncbi:MAG: RsmE family RNA methyltransferase [Fidelibacterota bacterium]
MTAERHYFVIDPEAVTGGDRFSLNGTEAHHLSRVARLHVGDEVILLDGKGNAHRGIIDAMEKERVSGRVLETMKEYHEPAVRIHLGVGNLKGSRMNTVAEKGTELGLWSLTPLIMKYGVKRGINVDRLRRVAVAAAKQCGRGRVPEVNRGRSYGEWCRNLPSEQSMIASNSPGSVPIHEWLDGVDNGVSDVWITVGPEGGYHADEERLAARCRIPFVTLGPRRLRSETAAITAVALCDTYFSNRRSP